MTPEATHPARPALPGAARSRPLLPIDARVRWALCALGSRYARQGVRVFLFGSVARSWPQAPAGADFDLGYEVDPAVPGRDVLLRQLRRDVETLPSIRPVDLVDFSRASAEFRGAAAECIVDLAHASAPPAAS
jgi:hypothetical protein